VADHSATDYDDSGQGDLGVTRRRFRINLHHRKWWMGW